MSDTLRRSALIVLIVAFIAWYQLGLDAPLRNAFEHFRDFSDWDNGNFGRIVNAGAEGLWRIHGGP
jgi:hypothetical protein